MGQRELKNVDAIKVGDYVVSLDQPRLYRVWDVSVEYDYDLPHAVWLKVIDVETGDKLDCSLNSADVTFPLKPMEVLAWASK